MECNFVLRVRKWRNDAIYLPSLPVKRDRNRRYFPTRLTFRNPLAAVVTYLRHFVKIDYTIIAVYAASLDAYSIFYDRCT